MKFFVNLILFSVISECSKIQSDTAEAILEAIMNPEAKISELEFKIRSPVDDFMEVKGLPTAAAHLGYLISLQRKAAATDLYFRVVRDAATLNQLKDNYYWKSVIRLFLETLNVPKSSLPPMPNAPDDSVPLKSDLEMIQPTPFTEMTLAEVQRELLTIGTPQQCQDTDPLSNCMKYLNLKWQEALLLAPKSPTKAITSIEESLRPFNDANVKFKVDPRIRYILFGLRLDDDGQKRVGVLLAKLDAFSLKRSKMKFTLLGTEAIKAKLQEEATRIAAEKAKLAAGTQAQGEDKKEATEDIEAQKSEAFAMLTSQLKSMIESRNYFGTVAVLRSIYSDYQEFPTLKMRMDHLAFILQRFPEQAASEEKEDFRNAFTGDLKELWHKEDMVPMIRALVRVISDNVMDFLVGQIMQIQEIQPEHVVFLKKQILDEIQELLEEDEIDIRFLSRLIIFFRLAPTSRDSLQSGFSFIEKFIQQSDMESTSVSKTEMSGKVDRLLSYFRDMAEKVKDEVGSESKNFSETFVNIIKTRCHPSDDKVAEAVDWLFKSSFGDVPTVDFDLMRAYLVPGRYSSVIAKDPSKIHSLIRGSELLEDKDLRKLWETFIDQTFTAIEDIKISEVLALDDYCRRCDYGPDRCLRSFKALNDGGKDSLDIARMAYCFLLNSQTDDPDKFAKLFEFSTLGLEELKEALHLVLRTFGYESQTTSMLIKQSLTFHDRAIAFMDHLNNSIEPLDSSNPDFNLYKTIVSIMKTLTKEDLAADKTIASPWLSSTALIIPEIYIDSKDIESLTAERKKIIGVISQVDFADADYIEATYRFALSAISYLKESGDYDVLGPLSQTLLEWAFSAGDLDLAHHLVNKCPAFLLNEYLVTYLKSPLTADQFSEFISVWRDKNFMFSKSIFEWNSLAEALAKNPNYPLLFKILREQTSSNWTEVNYESIDLPDELNSILAFKQNLLCFENEYPQVSSDFRYALMAKLIAYLQKCHDAEIARIVTVNRQYQELVEQNKKDGKAEKVPPPEIQTPFYVMIARLLERHDKSGFDKISGIFWAALAHFPHQPLHNRLYAATRALKCHPRIISNSNLGLLIQKHKAKPIRSNDILIEEILAVTKIDIKLIPMTEPDVELSLPEGRPVEFPKTDKEVIAATPSTSGDSITGFSGEEGLAESIQQKQLPKVKAIIVENQELVKCEDLSIDKLMEIFDGDEKGWRQITTQCVEELTDDVREQFLLDPSRLIKLKIGISASILKSIKPEVLRKMEPTQKGLILNDLMLNHSLAKKQDHPCSGISHALLSAFRDLPEYQDIFITSGFVSTKPFQSLPEDDPRAAAVIASITLAQGKSFKSDDFESIPTPLTLAAALALQSRPGIKHPFSIRRPASPPNYDLEDEALTPNIAKALAKQAERLQKQVTTDFMPKAFKEDEIKRNMAANVLSKRANWATSPPDFTEDSESDNEL